MAEMEMDPELAPELEAFRLRYPSDEAAWAYLLKSPIEVQKEVLRDFKPKMEGQDDYSALVISFCKRRRQVATQPSHYPQQVHTSPEIIEERRSMEGMVQELRTRYPFDDAAYNYIMASLPVVIREVLNSFKPPKEGEADYSALVISFAKKCRQSAFSDARQQEDAVEYEQFRQRYPFDEDTHNYLQTSNPDVRRYVMRSFKPPREGEADYSALLITYCKRCRMNMNNMNVNNMNNMGSFDAWGKGGGKGAGEIQQALGQILGAAAWGLAGCGGGGKGGGGGGGGGGMNFNFGGCGGGGFQDFNAPCGGCGSGCGGGCALGGCGGGCGSGCGGGSSAMRLHMRSKR
ncbi:hypothetical protein AK812_SmicGene14280 [Symbiodinium microadriaticum]|uniref:Uncharacterized protein n=1 Tax=Symbiodinium microadriaticum TaxID=2951 RepID=A0A1Q9E5Z1_SYMMI|nr:hypothetical protein AK812_SmicGene14280 [Symbiodinium microadriaticum]